MSDTAKRIRARQLRNYLRTFRKRLGLSQADVAYLFGHRRGIKISRYENGERLPALPTLLGLRRIYQVEVHELFAGLDEAVAREISRRARRFLRRLKDRRSPQAIRKRQILTILGEFPGRKSSRRNPR